MKLYKNTNKSRLSLLSKIAVGAFVISTLGGCKKMFDNTPENVLQQSQTFKTVYDADAAMLGIYGKFSNLSDRYIMLNEMRADLLDVTVKSNNYLRQLSTHAVTDDNPYADPRPFYEVIANCNDALKNMSRMYDQKLLDYNQYWQRAADLGLLRSWLYLQLGIHYGNVPYVTEPIDDINQLKDESKFAKISFNELLDRLIAYTSTIPAPFLDQNTSANSPTLIMATNNYVIKDGIFKFFIHRRSLLGDLQLWKGNYHKAAEYYKDVMETGTKLVTSTDYQIDQYDTYRITNDNSGASTLMTIGTTNPWQNIFSNDLAEAQTNRERMWTLPLDKNFGNKNPLVDLFSYSRNYLAKPSALAINNWNNQVRSDGGLTDRRGLNASYRMQGADAEVLKFTAKYNPSSPYEVTGVWILYRASELHLRYAEAANRDAHSKIAAAVLNDGLTKLGGSTTLAADGSVEVYPYDFKYNGAPNNGMWYRSIGIRGRAVNQNVTIDQTNLVEDTENKLIDEEGLENAFEGYRWADLLRIALRRQATDPNYLANKIGAKFDASGSQDAGAVRARLANKANWYLPFKWK
ncbi:SusD-like starch-binding protein associating with outer membrane [Mucilaginibacter yixingensis]|uniref:SusD-like starch-binding protein associating with outer membrane n=1 Tax=Mucilaginibacter yixingensis TaxID=1295612 RepID=A0A2T5JGE9_9SPHI|nr:RagB/SusD family nutrient uptake outer membrane protein [Mucilaginibacter yixingensis]PTR01436.1 SusD-like starch-binding protein associating with outer membrane [Mucilaginibacter yixingensis]